MSCSAEAEPQLGRLVDQAALVRHYVKWDDQPASLAAAVEGLIAADRSARTYPKAPMYVAGCGNSGAGVGRGSGHSGCRSLRRAAAHCRPQPLVPMLGPNARARPAVHVI